MTHGPLMSSLYFLTNSGHPLSMDPGPQTQLRTQNAKRVFHRRGPPRGPPRTQLRRKFQGTKSF